MIHMGFQPCSSSVQQILRLAIAQDHCLRTSCSPGARWVSMAALCNPTLPLGLGDDEFTDDLQALMPGSPFDLLLGNPGGALLDLSKVRPRFTRASVLCSQVLSMLAPTLSCMTACAYLGRIHLLQSSSCSLNMDSLAS